MTEKLIDEIETLFEDFKAEAIAKRDDKEMVGFWIPKELKEKYGRLQRASRGKLGKKLKAVVIRSIELAPDPAS